ncbi:MAG: DUF2780 domain-containing protein [Desulfobacteraceae bacterium]|nr:DUF2780 domain-containing protein [Desulfobacteraceae bacterium]MBC2757519.1 DUF2780 domain-containing protein [Desulfobacteraceae bacterium]
MKTKKITILIAVFSFLLMFFSAGIVCAETSGTMDLVKMLTSQLGVTEPQAAGGAGSLFDMAKGMLSETDYGQVAGAIPGIGDLIKAAPAVSESTADASDTMAGLAGGMGSITKAVDSANKFAAVNDQFKQLGLNADMVSQFIPVLLSFANSTGGESVMNILKSVWQ